MPSAAALPRADPTHAAALAEAERHVRGLRDFIEAHRFLLDRHIVDFYIADPPPLRCASVYTALWRQRWALRAVLDGDFATSVALQRTDRRPPSLFPPQWADALLHVRKTLSFLALTDQMAVQIDDVELLKLPMLRGVAISVRCVILPTCFVSMCPWMARVCCVVYVCCARRTLPLLTALQSTWPASLQAFLHKAHEMSLPSVRRTSPICCG